MIGDRQTQTGNRVARWSWSVAVALAAVTLVGCASVRPGLGNGSVLGYEGLARDIERFYNARAWERNATCPNPDLDRLLGASVISETDEEIVASIRYSWRDEGRDDVDDRRGRAISRGLTFSPCRGTDERRFTLEKVEDRVRIVAMSGEQRPRPLPN